MRQVFAVLVAVLAVAGAHRAAAFDALELPNAPPARPAALHAAMLEANPDLDADGVVVTCARGMLAELRLCVDRDLTPRACDAGLRARACPAGRVRVPPPRWV